MPNSGCASRGEIRGVLELNGGGCGDGRFGVVLGTPRREGDLSADLGVGDACVRKRGILVAEEGSGVDLGIRVDKVGGAWYDSTDSL